jgi:ActR/RegA family two-component response regulator
VQRGGLSLDELLRRYVTLVHADAGTNLEATARRLDVDRRAVKRYLDREFAARLRASP